MQLVSSQVQAEAAMGAVMVGYFLYYYETWILPALMRQEKMPHCWSAAKGKYHENLHQFNFGLDRDLRYSAVSKNLLLENLHHTKPKSLVSSVDKILSANAKLYDAFTPSSKRLLIWQVQPSLQ